MSQQCVPVERRQNFKLREIFEEAYVRIEPFLDPARGWNGSPLTVLAYRAVREAYAELSPDEVYTLVVAAVRVFNTRRSEAASKAGRPRGPAAA